MKKLCERCGNELTYVESVIYRDGKTPQHRPYWRHPSRRWCQGVTSTPPSWAGGLEGEGAEANEDEVSPPALNPSV